MLRVLLDLMDGTTLKRLGRRVVLSVVALFVLLLGVIFIAVAAYQAVARMLDGVDAALLIAAVLIVAAVGLFAVGSYQWRNRPKALLAKARYGVAREALSLLQTLIRKEPTKLVLAALVFGALAEFIESRDPDPDDES